MKQELPFPNDKEWRWRWMVTPSWGKLHRIASYTKRLDDGFVGVDGKSLCGITGKFQLPGLISRMSRERCNRCCRLAGVPAGKGAPFNSRRRWRSR